VRRKPADARSAFPPVWPSSRLGRSSRDRPRGKHWQ
jgi:hypothetical protein